MRKLLSAIVAVSLLLPVLAAPVAAIDPPQPMHGNQRCYSPEKQSLLSGQVTPSGWASQTAAFAQVDFHYDNCGDDTSAVSAWVGLHALAGGVLPTIVQAGIIQCRSELSLNSPTDPCWNHPNELRYFYAYGGCLGLGVNGPVARDFGPATPGVHSYKVVRRTDGWEMTAGGQTVFLSAGNVAISCVGSSTKTRSEYAVEKWDEGDSSGGSTTKTEFTAMRTYTSSTGWYDFNSASGNCIYVMNTPFHPSYCAKGSNWMLAWD